MTQPEQRVFTRPTLEKYELESSCYYSSARLWDDGVLDPVETRNALALGIAASLNAPIPAAARFGIFRM
jgi:acetyl-CoA carboxylase carboxyltransferase component